MSPTLAAAFLTSGRHLERAAHQQEHERQERPVHDVEGRRAAVGEVDHQVGDQPQTGQGGQDPAGVEAVRRGHRPLDLDLGRTRVDVELDHAVRTAWGHQGQGPGHHDHRDHCRDHVPRCERGLGDGDRLADLLDDERVGRRRRQRARPRVPHVPDDETGESGGDQQREVHPHALGPHLGGHLAGQQAARDQAEPPLHQGQQRGEDGDEHVRLHRSAGHCGHPGQPARTSRVLASMWPSSRTSAIWVMNSSSPDSPSPQPVSTAVGPASVSRRARAATTNVSRTANTSALGMNRSTTAFTGRMAPANGFRVVLVVSVIVRSIRRRSSMRPPTPSRHPAP